MQLDQLTVTAVLSPFQRSHKCFFCEPKSSVELHLFPPVGQLMETNGQWRGRAWIDMKVELLEIPASLVSRR